MTQQNGTIGGWDAPCAPFDYERMANEAQAECDLLKRRLDALKQKRARTGEEELARRREVCLLTDIYYEQRHKARFLRTRANARAVARERR